MPRTIGLGAMRLSTDSDRDEARALAVLGAAIDAGVNLIDTAPTYGLGQGDEHHNERLVARAIASVGDRQAVTVVTKCGMTRRGDAWVPDGRAKAIAQHCEENLSALGVSTIDLLLLHAVDPRTSIETSARALEELRAAGLATAIGLSNVSGAQLDAARRVAQIEAIELELGAFSDEAWKSGLGERAVREGLTLLLHSPLGGPKRAPRLARDPLLREIAAKLGVTAGAVTLAYHYALDERVVPLPGARHVETAVSAARAATVTLDDEDRARLDDRFRGAARAFGRLRVTAAPSGDREIVLVMGIQGAGKTTFVKSFEARGYARLNRDERGGTLKGLALDLDARLGSGEPRFVIDNTYGTRASRAEIVEVAERHGARSRCVHLDTPIEIAQSNVVERLVDRYGHLPTPEELRELQKKDPQALLPNALFRYQRELELPSRDEGFGEIETIAFERRGVAGTQRTGLLVAFEVMSSPAAADAARDGRDATLVFTWQGERDRESIDRAFAEATRGGRLGRSVELVVCPHPGGPPRCWCRPPLPGIAIPWMKRELVDPAQSALVGSSAAHRVLAKTLAIEFVAADGGAS